MISTGSGVNRDPIDALYFRSAGVRSPRNMASSGQVRTPRPTPKFIMKPEIYSTKKSRAGTPRESCPPKPPCKSAPPVRRIFPTRIIMKAQPVSFKQIKNKKLFYNYLYNENNKSLYVEQCYEIVGKIGIGSFGEVYKVRSKVDGELYAIKRTRERFSGESDRKRKLQEVEKLEKLPQHPNCVRFVMAWEERQHLYIQTELCKQSLQQFGEEKDDALPEKLVWNYLIDLLMALKHLHEHDLVHLDIKPDNIFITEDDRLKLGDFGLVLDVSKISSAGGHCEAQEGDPKYMAPELLEGKYGKSADLFSVGVTILELACNFDTPTNGPLWHDLRSNKLPRDLLSRLSPDLRCVIHRMLNPDPYKRATAMDILQCTEMRDRWSRRKGHYPWIKFVKGLRAIGYGMSLIFSAAWLIINYPFKGHFRAITPKPGEKRTFNSSFSDDDEAMDTSQVSPNTFNHSMDTSIDDYSMSSDDSIKDSDGFTIPR